jgi:hypothetical protein
MLCRWVPAFSKTLMCHLRTDRDLRKELDVSSPPRPFARLLLAAIGKRAPPPEES